MTIRFYLPTTGTPSITPSFDGGWNQTTNADRIEMVTSKISSSFVNKTEAETNATSGWTVLWRQFISVEQWEAYSFTGSDTWKLQLRCMEDNALANDYLYIIAKVVQSDGTIRGTLISAVVDGSEFVKTTYTNRSMSGSCQTISMQDSDHILLEIGYQANNTKTAPYIGGAEFGDNSGSDLPEDDSSTSQFCPWLELSSTLVEFSTVKAFIGTIGSASDIPDVPLKRTREFVSVAVAGVSNIVDASLKRIRGFIGSISLPLFNELVDGGLEDWVSATDLTSWIEEIQGATTVNREATEIHGGIYSCRIDVDASNNEGLIRQAVSLGEGHRYHVTVWFKIPVGKSGKIKLKAS